MKRGSIEKGSRMKEWKRLTNPEVDGVDRRLPVLTPIGLIEAHGPHLSLSVDIDTAEYFSRAITERTGATRAPGLPYGFADEMREYPGTIGLKPSTFTTVIAELGVDVLLPWLPEPDLRQRPWSAQGSG